MGNGVLAKAPLAAALKPKLAADALLVSDANPAYTAFCDAEGFSHETVNLSQGQRINGAYHVQNVNAYHSRFKQWLAGTLPRRGNPLPAKLLWLAAGF